MKSVIRRIFTNNFNKYAKMNANFFTKGGFLSKANFSEKIDTEMKINCKNIFFKIIF